jgi:hypothetical protein
MQPTTFNRHLAAYCTYQIETLINAILDISPSYAQLLAGSLVSRPSIKAAEVGIPQPAHLVRQQGRAIGN